MKTLLFAVFALFAATSCVSPYYYHGNHHGNGGAPEGYYDHEHGHYAANHGHGHDCGHGYGAWDSAGPVN
jgi:hypothetical protein